MSTDTKNKTSRRSSPLSAAGRKEKRYEISADLVSLGEAASRLGVGEGELLSDLRKRNQRSLVMGRWGWLVDLQALARLFEAESFEAPSFEIDEYNVTLV